MRSAAFFGGLLLCTSACSSGPSESSYSLQRGVSASCGPVDAQARAESGRAVAAAPTDCVADDDCVYYEGSTRCAYNCYGTGRRRARCGGTRRRARLY